MNKITINLCCVKCFYDDFLNEHFLKHGTPGFCDSCNEDSNHCLPPSNLKSIFTPLVSLYVDIVSFMPMEELKETDGEVIWEKICDTFGIFSDSSKSENLFRGIMGKDCDYDACVDIEFLHYDLDRDISEELKSKWNQLKEDLKHKNRFFNAQLDELMNFLSMLVTEIDKDNVFFRARKCDGKLLGPEKMGRPPSETAIAGRGNPEGISYLYLASDELTAVSELKPYIDQHVTVGKFKLTEKFKLIDLRLNKMHSPFRYGKEIKKWLDVSDVFYLLGRELSKPVEPQTKNTNLEYLPTQYLCELIKTKGYDGVLYKSTLGKGFNVLLFSDTNIICEKTDLLKIEEMNYSTIPIVKIEDS